MLTSSILLILLILGIYAYLLSSPKLPANTDEIIQDVLDADTVEQITGDTGFADSDGVSIWYNHIPAVGDKRGAIILVMGHSTNIFGWPDYLIDVLLGAGYDVIRYDNRGIGMSDWVKRWSVESAYSLEDMAKDCIAILDHLKLDKVHLVGASMGGMIAQRLAISYGQRFHTLTSIMSSGFMADPKLTLVPAPFKRGMSKILGRYGWRPTEKNSIKIGISLVRLLRNNKSHRVDAKDIAQKMKYDMRERKGFNRRVLKQHNKAIELSGSRYDELGSIAIPTLVIHGKRDPLVKIEHAHKYAPMIPHVKTLYLDKMGHDLPRELNEDISRAILSLISGS